MIFEFGDVVEFIDTRNWCWQGKGAIGIVISYSVFKHTEADKYDIYIQWADKVLGNPEFPYIAADFKLVSKASKLSKLIVF